MDSVFDTIVVMQDKTLTGEWNAVTLFILVFVLFNIGVYLYNQLKGIENNKKENMNTGLKLAIGAVVLNYITGKLFKSRQKVYRKKGFSKQRSMAQAYSDARMGQVLGAVVRP